MKILTLSDRTPTYSIKQMVEEQNPDMIFTLGDFHSLALAELADINHIPKLGVYGNHCSRGYLEEYGIINMHLNTFEYKGTAFGGFEGCVRYKTSTTAPTFTQEECTEMMTNFPRVDVFLSHCPPFGINDDHHDPNDLSHVGFTAFLDYLEKYSPAAWFHGHTYPNPIQTTYKNTFIYYVEGQGIVESGKAGVVKI
jgi:Icc-related predicted phosphoesterase